MADLSKWSSSNITCFSTTFGYGGKPILPESISCYVYDPYNAVIYTTNEPLSVDPEGNPLGAGTYRFHVPGILTVTTKPETYYSVVSVAQYPDGSTAGDAIVVSVV